MKYHIKRYTELSSKEINQIKNLIIEGDEVDVETLAERLSNVERISFFLENEEVISTASIKIPINNYKKNTFINSKSNINNEDFEYELGYISTSKNFQGQKLASKLCAELCSLYSNHNIFSTTRIDNDSMKSILAKNNFKETGIEFPNKKQSGFLKLYLKNK
jgi:ribosomal protein S18 acetylase RimI-like enzyme